LFTGKKNKECVETIVKSQDFRNNKQNNGYCGTHRVRDLSCYVAESYSGRLKLEAKGGGP